MAKVTLKGVEYEIAPFMLEQIEQSARFIDQVNNGYAAAKDGKPSMTQMAQIAAGLLGTFAVGIAKTHPTVTLEKLRGEISFAEAISQQASFRDILLEAGLVPLGKTGAPPSPAKARASRSKAKSAA